MSGDPSTPQGSRAAERVAVPFMSAVKSSKSILEPSPALSRGETALNSSSPATPQDRLSSGTHHGHFVRHSMDARAEDPFVEKFGSSPTDPPSGDFLKDSPAHRRTQSTTALGVTVGAMEYSPRPDRVGQEVSPANAQGVYPPGACVFVANLANGRTDDQLMESVGRVFTQFGCCYIKIRRDRNRMPFAFCQYQTIAEAEKAVFAGRGMEIDGRQCRTETAKVNRSVFLSRHDGKKISPEQACRILGKYGAIQRTMKVTEDDKHKFKLPEGIWVKFAYFQDCRDAQLSFMNHRMYTVATPVLPDDMHSALAEDLQLFQSPTQGRNTQVLPQQPAPSVAARRSSRARRNAFSGNSPSGQRPFEPCFIWVANCPPELNQETLIDAFHKYGKVTSVSIMTRGTTEQPNTNTFAFVSFSDDDAVVSLLKADDKPIINGFHLHVERKFLFGERAPDRRRAGRVHGPGQDAPSGFLSLSGARRLEPMNVLSKVFNFALEHGVPFEVANQMVELGRCCLEHPGPRPNPFGFTFQPDQDMMANNNIGRFHPQQTLATPSTFTRYGFPDTPIASTAAPQMMMASSSVLSPLPLRFNQVNHLDMQGPPPAAIFEPIEGPVVRDSTSPLVVSSSGPRQAALVTTLPPAGGEVNLADNAWMEGTPANNAQEDSSNGGQNISENVGGKIEEDLEGMW